MAKTLISFTVTARLDCAFVFSKAKIRFLHDAAHPEFCLLEPHSENVVFFFA